MVDIDDIRLNRPESEPEPEPELGSLAPLEARPGAAADTPSEPQIAPEADSLRGQTDEGNRPASKKMAMIALVAVLFALITVVAVYFWLRTPTVPEIGTVASLSADASDLAGSEPPPTVETEATPGFELPSLAQSDGVVRAMASALSSHPKLAQWLVNDELIRRFTLVVANAAYDENPAVHVGFLRPSGRFEASTLGEDLVVSAASQRRYDLLVDVFTSIDPEGAAELYRKFRPLIEQEYDGLGYPGRFETALRRAAQRVLEAPAGAGDGALEPWIQGFRFENPELEELAPVQKVLVRMGPRNQLRVQNQVRSLLNAVDRVTR